MREAMVKNWWVALFRGIMAILFGVVAIFYPGEAFTALIWIFGIYAVIDGAMTLYNAFTKPIDNRIWEIIEGLVAVLAGLFAFRWTALTGLTLVFLIGIWAIITGVMQVAAAWRLRQEMENEVWLGLAGVLSVIMGILFLFNPLGGALATVWMIGIYSIAFGVLFIMLAFRLRDDDTTITHNNTPSPA